MLRAINLSSPYNATTSNRSAQCEPAMAQVRYGDDGVCFGAGQFQPKGNKRRDEKRDATLLKQYLPYVATLVPLVVLAVALLHPGCNTEKKKDVENGRNSLIDALTPKDSKK